jgi:hypothetical protein
MPPARVLDNPHARNILHAIDGVRSIASIALHVHASEFIVSKFLFDLHAAGHLEILSNGGRPSAPLPRLAGQQGPAESEDDLISRGSILLEAGDYQAAIRLLSQADGDRREAQRLIEQAEALLTEKIYRLHLPGHSIPILARPMSEMVDERLSAEESYLLSRIDGMWDIDSIISISPLREVDALVTLDSLRERGLISLE